MNNRGVVKTASNVIRREQRLVCKRGERGKRRSCATHSVPKYNTRKQWAAFKRDLMVTAFAIVTGAALIMGVSTSIVTATPHRLASNTDYWAR